MFVIKGDVLYIKSEPTDRTPFGKAFEYTDDLQRARRFCDSQQALYFVQHVVMSNMKDSNRTSKYHNSLRLVRVREADPAVIPIVSVEVI